MINGSTNARHWFVRRFKQARQLSGMTVSQAAQACKLREEEVRWYENQRAVGAGGHNFPRPQDLDAIAAGLGYPLSFFLMSDAEATAYLASLE